MCVRACRRVTVLWLTEVGDRGDPQTAPSAEVTLHKTRKSHLFFLSSVSCPLILSSPCPSHTLLLCNSPTRSKLACQKWEKMPSAKTFRESYPISFVIISSAFSEEIRLTILFPVWFGSYRRSVQWETHSDSGWGSDIQASVVCLLSAP